MDFAFGGRRATLVGMKQLYDVDSFSENRTRGLFYDDQPTVWWKKSNWNIDKKIYMIIFNKKLDIEFICKENCILMELF